MFCNVSLRNKIEKVGNRFLFYVQHFSKQMRRINIGLNEKEINLSKEKSLNEI